MLGRLDVRQMQKMMQQMGIKNEEIEAEEVIIKQKNRDLVISNPQVTKISMGGQDTLQVVGKMEERSREEFSEDDIKMIIEQTGASKEDVISTLKETKDIAETILRLKK